MNMNWRRLLIFISWQNMSTLIPWMEIIAWHHSDIDKPNVSRESPIRADQNCLFVSKLF